MIQLRVLNGKKAGQSILVHRFPCSVGRAPNRTLPLTEEGVWDHHFDIALNEHEGFLFLLQTNALALINGESCSRKVLRNGDMIEAGSARLQFWLSETRQLSQRWREWATWLFIALLCLTQIALIYWLSQ